LPPLARALSVSASLAIAALSAPGVARAATCPASHYTAKSPSIDGALLEAGALTTTGAYGDARAVYLEVLARQPDNPEALYGLARVDAWEGCSALAEREYRRALSLEPTNADLRGGLIDVLSWNGRYAEAEALLDSGLALDPKSAALLSRRARLLSWKGDASEAIRMADLAEARSPDDLEIRTMRDRLFSNEVRVGTHLDRFPGQYQDLYWMSVAGLRRFGRFELSAGAQLLRREGAHTETVTDARYPVALQYHPTIGTTVGAEVGIGAPAAAIPRFTARVFALLPVTPKVSTYLAYAFWRFDSGAVVHMLQPSLGIDLPFDLRLEGRLWLSSVSLPATGDAAKPGVSRFAAAGGPALQWTADPRLTFSLFYTYGAELDSNPTLYQLLSFTSNTAGLFADKLLTRHFGLRPLVSVQRRSAPSEEIIWIGSVELGAYVRW
jgi:YaiO family outer membrane protein